MNQYLKVFSVPKAKLWGEWSFTRFLERNKIPYSVVNQDMAELDITFDSTNDVDRASEIWYNLTGSRTIGKQP